MSLPLVYIIILYFRLFRNGDICHYIDMKKINDPKKLKKMIESRGIDRYFSDPDLPFELYSFEKGEFLSNELDPFDYFSFIVSGSLRILNIRDDGSLYQIAAGSGFAMLGDIEFGCGTASPYLIEVVRKTYCVSLPLDRFRLQLENDPVFLRTLLRETALKLNTVTASLAIPKTLSERVLHYMENECENRTLTGIEKTASRLSCSKRQLLRILKDLAAEKKIIRAGRGRYVLIQ